MEPQLYHAPPNLFQASEQGNLLLVRQLFKQHPEEVHTENEAGWSPVHLAVKSGQLEVLQFFYEQNVHLARTTASEQLTPLMLACLYNKTDVVNFLLSVYDDKARAMKDVRGNSHLHYAAFSDEVLPFQQASDEEIATSNQDADTPLRIAFQEGSTKVVDYLYTVRVLRLEPKHAAVSLWHELARLGHLDIAKVLIRFDNNLFGRDEHGATLAHVAALSGKCALLSFLHHHAHSLFDVPDHNGNFPAHYAAVNGTPVVVEWFRATQHWISAVNKDGQTPEELLMASC